MSSLQDHSEFDPARPRKATQHRPKNRGNGDGTIYQRADGMWCASLKAENGQRKYLYSKSRATVSKRLAEAMNNLHRGLPVGQKQQTVGAWLDYWLEQVIRPEREPTTYEGYEISVRKHIKPYLGTKVLPKLQPEDVERWLHQLDAAGAGVRTRQFALSRLRTALNLALKRGHLGRNVAELVDAPRQARRKHQAPRIVDLQRLLEVTRDDRQHALLVVALGLGLRRGEVLGLQWEDVDLDARTLDVRRQVTRTRREGLLVREHAKTESGERIVLLPELIVRALRRHQSKQFQDRLLAGSRWKGPDYPDGKPMGFVFTSEVGTIIEPRRVDSYFTRACERAGLSKRTYHGLRHDFASLLLAAGVPGRVVMEMMGHSNYALTANRYQHVPDELQREAAERIGALLAGSAAS